MRWEYFVHVFNVQGMFSTGHVNPREMQDAMNYYGQQGWELVSAFDTNSGQGGSCLVVLTFKRPLAPMPVVPVRQA